MAVSWRRRSLRNRVLVLVLLGLLVTLGVLGALAVSSLRAIVRDSLQERLLLARTVANRMDSVLNQNLARLHRAGEARNRGQALDEEVLRQVYHNSIFTKGVFVMDAQGAVIRAEPFRRAPVTTAMASSAPVRQALRERRPVISSQHMSDPWGAQIVTMLIPLLDERGELQGLLGGEVDLSSRALQEVLETAQVGESGSTDLVDSRGTVLASTRIQRVLTESDHGAVLAGLIRDRRDSVSSCHNCHGQEPSDRERDVMALAPLSTAPWAVVVRQSEAEALGSARRMERGFMAAGLLLGGLALALSWGAALSITRPVELLTRAARRIAAGNLDDPLPDLGEDEVGRLGEAFDAMRERLRESREQIQQWNRELEDRVRERTRALEESETRRRELLRKVISAQEDERRRVARELHDSTCQELAALVVGLQTAVGLPASHLPDKVEDLKGLAVRTLDGVHGIMLDLRPSLLDDLGLEAALRWYAEKTLESRGVEVVFERSGDERRLPSEVETTVFRVAQEALSNVARHSGAENVLIDLSYGESAVSVEVEDDGSGFDPREFDRGLDGTRGLGLLGMKERVSLLGGNFSVSSSPESGTRIRLEVPLA